MSSHSPSPKDHAYDEVMSEILSYSRTLKKEKNLTLFIRGLSYSGLDKVYDGKIHTVTIGYLTDMNIQIDEARILLYSVVDSFLAHLNSLSHLQNYYANYPLSYENIDCCLGFSFRDNNLKKDNVSSAHLLWKKAVYRIVENPTSDLLTHRKMSDDVYILENGYERTQSIVLPVEEDLILLTAQNTAQSEVQNQTALPSRD
jgi:hypothetical protein